MGLLKVYTLLRVLVPSTISKCFLPSLKSGGLIPPHTDKGVTLRTVHRIHVPIYTNPSAIFTVGGESINMLEGSAYEINNVREHSVINEGRTPRVHLLFDLYCY
jgi:hypothetical protein